MESINVEKDWDRNNSSSFNGSHSGGFLFGIFAENASNTTAHTLPQPRIRDLSLARAEIAVLGIVLALNTLGNSFVLWVLLRRRKHNAPMHLFMVNLCVADLVVALFQVLPQLIWDITERFQGPDFLCRSVKYLQIVGMFASSYMIVAMTVDRHRAICCPLQAYRVGALSRWNTPVMMAWVLALVLSLPQVFIFSRTEVAPGDYECWGHFAESWGLKAYVTWMTMAVFLLPALIITICQIRIFREIHNNIYLKSERTVMAEVKKSDILLRLHGLKKEDEHGKETQTSGGAGMDESEGQLLRGVNNNPHNGINSAQVGECYDCAPSALQYSSCCGERLTTTTTSAVQQQMLNSSDFQEPHTNSPRCSLEYAPPHSPATPPPSITKAMSKTIRMTLVIVLVYTICWSPFFIVQLWAAWDPNPPDQGVAFTILMLLASLNSCTNPWIYTAFSSSVSRELQSLLHCRSRLGRRGSLHDDSTTTHTFITKDNPY
ncbi:hypothetical protein OJAV_G00065160 [Oryzias javanicus]|uniref:G-protein coupled receptors family 1 profile domain-containing protein n=1 Tax=Oryzias javanicus TaxID=123683 RepID=A0A437D5M4_ORYJA|nr:hypothetical protein OJAV_G00065160 [Oryzias javanicus]